MTGARSAARLPRDRFQGIGSRGPLEHLRAAVPLTPEPPPFLAARQAASSRPTHAPTPSSAEARREGGGVVYGCHASQDVCLREEGGLTRGSRVSFITHSVGRWQSNRNHDTNPFPLPPVSFRASILLPSSSPPVSPPGIPYATRYSQVPDIFIRD